MGAGRYFVWNGVGGGGSISASWEYLDFNVGVKKEIYPNRWLASFPCLWRDSLYVLNNKVIIRDSITGLANFNAYDTNTVYYLTHINLRKGRSEILDSIRLPFVKMHSTKLSFHPEEGEWGLLYQDWRIRFKEGSFHPETVYQDSRLDLNAFAWLHIDTEMMRRVYFNRGIHQAFINANQDLFIEAYFSPYDSSYYDFSDLSQYVSLENFNGYWLSDGVWQGREYQGSITDLALVKKSLGVRDLMLARQDSLKLFRFEDGKISRYRGLSYQNLPQAAYRTVLSNSEGGFYLGGNVLDQDGRTQRPILVYVDPLGRTSYGQDPETFNLHYNPQSQSLKVFYKDPARQFNYRIIDASGRNMQEGEFQAYEGISLGDWQTGIYRIQLWTKAGTYLGQEAFLISHP